MKMKISAENESRNFVWQHGVCLNNLWMILAVSDWTLEAIFFTMCNSQLIAFLLYQNDTFEDQ